MEVPTALLVALMFVTLISIGIGNILMSLASMVDRRSPVTASRLHLSWIVILLLTFFSLFWFTLDVLAVEEWTFIEFLYVMLGPVLILFASQILLPRASSEGAADLDENYFEVSRPFFLFLAGTQVWVNGVDLILKDGLVLAGALNGFIGVIALILAFSTSRKIHVMLTVLIWVIFALRWILQALGN